MRTTDRILSLVIGLALFALSVLVVVEVIYAAVNNPKPLFLPYPQVAEFFRTHSWSAGWIVTGAVVLALLGLLLLVSEVRRRRPALLAMQSADPQVVAGISRRSIQRVLDAEIGAVPGVGKTSTRVGRRTVRVKAVRWAGAPDNVGPEARERGEAALAGLRLQKPPSLSLTLRSGRDS